MLQKISSPDLEKIDMRMNLAVEASEKLKANERVNALTLEL